MRFGAGDRLLGPERQPGARKLTPEQREVPLVGFTSRDRAEFETRWVPGARVADDPLRAEPTSRACTLVMPCSALFARAITGFDSAATAGASDVAEEEMVREALALSTDVVASGAAGVSMSVATGVTVADRSGVDSWIVSRKRPVAPRT